jgi:hypothetical protein
MDVYGFCLALGAVGLVAMALSGLSHAAHHGRGAHASNGHAGHAGHVVHAARGAAGGHHGNSAIYSLLSPRVLFALLVGFGAGGFVAAPLGEPWRAGTALLIAAAFEGLLVGPFWRLLFRFESSPAATLDSAVEDYARTVMDFDANGQGLVALEVDGQIVQLLATLAPDDRARGVRIRTGDLVRVSRIDAARNRCTVRLRDS